MKRRKTVITAGIYIGVFLALFYIFYRVPYCHDEWHWGLDERIQLMKDGFKNYNGRYLGNLLALLITRSRIAKGLVLSLGTLWIAYVMNDCLKLHRKKQSLSVFFLLSIFSFLLAVPSGLFAQSYGWPAAFVNFVPPAILFLIYFNWTQTVYMDEELQYPRWKTLMAIPLGISTQLFSEHITIFAVLYAGWIVVLSFIRYRKIFAMQVTYLFATIGGALIMFTNGAYSNAVSKTDGYKEIGGGLELWLSNYRKITDNLFLDNWLLNIGIVLLLLIIMQGIKEKGLLNKFLLLIITGYASYSTWHKICPSWVFLSNEDMNSKVEMLLATIFFLAILTCLFLYVKPPLQYVACVLYGAMFCVSIPLLVASPIGPRCFFISYVIQAIVMLLLLQDVLNERNINMQNLTFVAGVLCVFLCVVYMKMFHTVGHYDQIRSQRIEQAVEAQAEEVVLPHLPYSAYFWTTEPTNGTWEQRFKEFYHIPEDMVVRFE